MKVKEIIIEELENAGCNNGNYPLFTVVFDNGQTAEGRTCRCGCGCSGMDQLPEIGQWFETLDDFRSYSECEF